MTDSNTQEPNDQVDFFTQMTTQFEKVNQNFSSSIEKTLPDEVILNGKEQAESGEKFCNEIKNEASEIRWRIRELSKKIETHIEQGLNKSYLKSKFEKYDECLEPIQTTRLHRLLDLDIDACKHMAEDSKSANIKTVVANYNDFMAQQ